MTARSSIAGLLLALAALAPCPARADAGASGADTLQRPLGARAPGMGTAFAAVDGGIDSIGYNAAGIMASSRPAVQMSYERGIVDDYFSHAAYVHPVGRVVLAASALYYDAGNVSVTAPGGNIQSVKAQQNYAQMLGLGLNIGGGLSAGAIIKVYEFNLGQQAYANGYAADGGLIWHTPLDGLNLGASLQNMGPNVRYEVQSDALPLTFRTGFAYLLDLERFGYTPQEVPTFFMKYLFTADAILTTRQPATGGAGVELDMPFGKTSHIAVRGGTLINNNLQGLTLGVSFREKHFSVDYAFGLVSSGFGDENRVSIGYEF